MLQKYLLKKLAENEPNQKIGGELFATPMKKGDFKPGKSFEEIRKAMEKASKEQLLRIRDDVSYC